MTTPNIPDLPHTLGVSTGGAEVPLQVVRVLGRTSVARAGDVLISSNANDDRDSGIGWYTPADLIRELARFVPIPAEARKVITAWINEPIVHEADHLLATLAAAGLLVGPGEPAASGGEPVGMVDTVGRTWGRDLVNGSPGLCFRHPDVDEAYPLEELRARYGPLTPLCAHPPVTAEPATAPSVTDASADNSDATVSAPSVEQIRKVMRDSPSIVTMQEELATAIHALWSPAPGDAAALARTSEQYHRAQQYAVKATALEGQRNEARAEVERLRAALEAAERRANEWKAHWRIARMEDVDHDEQCIEIGIATGDMHRAAARAAVEAEKCMGAGDCAVSVHVHGCYADVPPAKCDDASEHAVEADTTEGA